MRSGRSPGAVHIWLRPPMLGVRHSSRNDIHSRAFSALADPACFLQAWTVSAVAIHMRGAATIHIYEIVNT